MTSVFILIKIITCIKIIIHSYYVVRAGEIDPWKGCTLLEQSLPQQMRESFDKSLYYPICKI